MLSLNLKFDHSIHTIVGVHTLLKHKVLMVCPLTPPKLKVLYSTLPATAKPPSLSLPTNQLVSSSSVQLQLVTRKTPPLLTSGAMRPAYSSHSRLPRWSRWSDSETASNVPLSRTTSQPPFCSPPKTSAYEPPTMSHSANSTGAAAALDEATCLASATLCGL